VALVCGSSFCYQAGKAFRQTRLVVSSMLKLKRAKSPLGLFQCVYLAVSAPGVLPETMERNFYDGSLESRRFLRPNNSVKGLRRLMNDTEAYLQIVSFK